MENYRIESDLIGELKVPADALYGVQTARGIENFRISKYKLSDYPWLIRGLAYTKYGAAEANHELGLLPEEIYKSIVATCKEILVGTHDASFPVDMIQGGAGTTTNMNINEVIANRSLQLMGYKLGDYAHCSPNDHVNCSQSTNDAYPTAVHLGLYGLTQEFLKCYGALITSFELKSKSFSKILKMGRTQLEDAVPMTLGQTFGAFASILRDEVDHVRSAANELLTVNMGATAVGTGICSVPGYAQHCVAALGRLTGWDVRLADDLVAATSDTSSLVGYAAVLKRIATKLNKICNDLRLLNSGPRCGLHEIDLPARQPGSSIMPGKVNPVIPEVMNQICYKVIGNELCITMCNEAAQMELNAMEPVMVQCCFESVELLMHGFDALREYCIDGIVADEAKCTDYLHHSIGIVTALNPIIGYKNSTRIAKEALATGSSVYDLVLKEGLLTREELDTILSPENTLHPVERIKK